MPAHVDSLRPAAGPAAAGGGPASPPPAGRPGPAVRVTRSVDDHVAAALAGARFLACALA